MIGTPQRLSVGRIVIAIGAAIDGLGQRIHPAVIVGVPQTGADATPRVDLTVFPEAGEPRSFRAVPLLESADAGMKAARGSKNAKGRPASEGGIVAFLPIRPQARTPAILPQVA